MKENTIKINKVTDKKKYLDESYSIIAHYRKLINNPKKKIISFLKEQIYIVSALTLYIVLILYWSRLDTKIFSFILGIYFITLVVYIKRYISAYKFISKKGEEETDSFITINKENVIFRNNKTKVTFEFSWEDIKYILLTENCISFLPTTIEKTFMIVIPIDYKDEFLKLIKI